MDKHDKAAANSANPRQHEPMRPWNDEEWDSYLYAVSSDYRVEQHLAHGDVEAAQDEVDSERERRLEEGTWDDEDEDDYIEGGWADGEDEDSSETGE